MIRSLFLMISAILLSASLVSCSSASGKSSEEPDCKVVKASIIQDAEATKTMIEHAELFRTSISSKCTETAVYLNENIYKLYEGRPKVIAARCMILGITDVYCQIDFDQFGKNEYDQNLAWLIKAFHSAGIKSHAMIFDPALYSKNLCRQRIISVRKFNVKNQSESKFDGVLIAIRPEVFSRAEEEFNKGLLYHWDDENYGSGKDNDMLVKQALSILKEAKENRNKLTLAQSLSHTLEGDVSKASVSCGSVNDFLQYAERLLILADSSDKRDIFDFVSLQLAKASKPQSIVISVKTSKNIYGDKIRDTSLSWKSWFRICKDMEYVIQSSKSSPSFRGVAFQDYEGLEKAWE